MLPFSGDSKYKYLANADLLTPVTGLVMLYTEVILISMLLGRKAQTSEYKMLIIIKMPL